MFVVNNKIIYLFVVVSLAMCSESNADQSLGIRPDVGNAFEKKQEPVLDERLTPKLFFRTFFHGKYEPRILNTQQPIPLDVLRTEVRSNSIVAFIEKYPTKTRLDINRNEKSDSYIEHVIDTNGDSFVDKIIISTDHALDESLDLPRAIHFSTNAQGSWEEHELMYMPLFDYWVMYDLSLRYELHDQMQDEKSMSPDLVSIERVFSNDSAIKASDVAAVDYGTYVNFISG